MTMYFQSVVIPVKIENKGAFLQMTRKMSSFFADHGATRSVECWGDDLMDGKVTDFRKAVQANDDETVVLSWDCWPDKTSYDAAMKQIMTNNRMKSEDPMPFDGRRLIHGAFEICFDTGGSELFGYLDGMVASVPDGNRQAFIDHGAKVARLFKEQGARRVVDGWGVDVPNGKLTDFRRAVHAKEGETVVVGWIEWPDRATRDRGMGAIMQDPRMREALPAWNGPLAIFGGFTPIHDSARA
jgi:uncharacterized protein YbaA (DUF1428 family)